jgi:hypothetical protein
MLNEVMHIEDEHEARRILMKLGNGLAQVDSYIVQWKEAKPASVVVQKVVTNVDVEKETEAPKQPKTIITKQVKAPVKKIADTTTEV